MQRVNPNAWNRHVRWLPGPTALALPFLVLATAALSGCAPEALEPLSVAPGHVLRSASLSEYPMDDVLRLNHLQAKGTHNSYHVETLPIPAWQYTHAPLDQQLESQGVRKVELDVYYNFVADRFEVLHVLIFDAGTTCRVFRDCMELIRGWSDGHPGHHPLFIQIEPKDQVRGPSAEEYLTLLEEEITVTWPVDRIITPDSVQGSWSSLSEALEQEGWPTLGEVRGNVLFYLDNGDEFRDAYTYNGAGLERRLMFADGGVDASYSAVTVINDPIADFDKIQSAVNAGLIVRTRADTDGQEARDGDTTRLEAALASGAQIVSTDFPAPVEDLDYWVEIPGGTPSRCNPLTAPDNCTSEAIEAPSLLSSIAR